MLGQMYRLKTPTLAILAEDGQSTPVSSSAGLSLTTIPVGAEVEVIGGPLNGNRLVDIRWEGKTVMVFTKDVRDRGERLLPLGAKNVNHDLAHYPT
jgi:hypothetical protein